MAIKDFKPLYKTEYTSQGALINDVFPEEVRQILSFIKMLEMKNKDAIELTLSWLGAKFPPYKKFFPKYNELIKELEECRRLTTEWKNRKVVSFPLTLKNNLYKLYENWWEAYNGSGAGIKGGVYIPRETRVRKAIQNL